MARREPGFDQVKLLRRIAIGVVVLAVVAYLGVLGFVYVNQRGLEYAPGGDVLALQATALTGATAVSIPTADGASLAGWYEPPRDGRPLIVYFHGNAENFTAEHARYEAFAADGYGFLSFDYRGFPASPGELNQAHVLADALTAFDWAAGKGFPIVLWGRSLGSGPATYVASVRDAEALLLETPFVSAVAVAGERYPYLPVGLLMDDKYPLDQWIADVEEPVFVAHGDADTTIPVSNGRRVYELAPNKDELWIEPGANHSDLWDRGIWERAKGFFSRAEAIDVE
jgi:fermentation-respiration switch protein FrsA (DUF1100 family)